MNLTKWNFKTKKKTNKDDFTFISKKDGKVYPRKNAKRFFINNPFIGFALGDAKKGETVSVQISGEHIVEIA